MKKNKRQESFYEESAKIFKLLSSPVRLRLINFISFCPRTVEDCARKLGQSVQNTSLHLISLAEAKVLEVEQIKNYRFYSLAETRIVQLLSAALISDSRSLLSSDLLFHGDWHQLAELVLQKKVVLIDLRERDEIEFIPVSGATSFDGPPAKIKEFLNFVPTNRQLVFICRGRWCQRLAQTVEEASRHRKNVKGASLTALELKELNVGLTQLQ